jgi:predicted metal-dependent HD superfamily phosphohydrolase
VALAAFLHDVVYDSRASDNEERSAEYARELLTGFGAERDVREETARLILLTKTHEASADDDGCRLLDADLSILGAEPEVYDAYARAIRQEYAWVPEEEYRAGRRRVLERFLARPHIYFTPAFRAREDQARSNIAHEIASLH